MLIEEFAKLTGFEPTGKEYKAIETEYMKTDIDKKTFCEQWINDRKVLEILQARINGNIELPHIKRYTNKELMSLVVERVKRAGEYEKAEKILDYFLPEDDKVVTLTRYGFDFHAIADFGSSEGIYLSCHIVGVFDESKKERCKMGTFKTLKDDLESMKIMAELGGILNFFLSEFVNQNIENFASDEERKQWAIQRAKWEYDKRVKTE